MEGTEIKTEMLIPVVNINNRHKRRQAEFEADKISTELLTITHTFHALLFDEMLNIDYFQLYTHYLEEYTRAVDFNNRVRKPRYFRINECYFSDLFKPLEKATEHAQAT